MDKKVYNKIKLQYIKEKDIIIFHTGAFFALQSPMSKNI